MLNRGAYGAYFIYLKSAYTVPAFLFVHTDWITFARDSLKFSQPAMSRLRTNTTSFYRSYDRVLVLIKEQKRWSVD
jgi:hypothetical protein